MSDSNVFEMVSMAEIECDGTQTRAALRPEAIRDYAAKLDAGEEMDPCVVFRDGQKTWLAAGHHRRDAYKSLGRTELPCVVKQGSKWEAIEYGIRDNLQHRGERLSREDKRHNVFLALRENPGLADVAMAQLCGVSDKTVAKCRREFEASSEIPKTTTRVGRDGRRRDTRNIGRKTRTKQATQDKHAKDGRLVNADANVDVDPPTKDDSTGPISSAAQPPLNSTGGGEPQSRLDELHKCWSECCRKLGKLLDQLFDMFELAKKMEPDGARQSRTHHGACKDHAKELGAALEAWRKELGIRDPRERSDGVTAGRERGGSR